MLQDLRLGVRVVLENKGWTVDVVLSLALGIGANTTLFSAVSGLLLKTIPVDRPESLVRIKWAGKNDMGNDFSDYGNSAKNPAGEDVHPTFPFPIFREFQKTNQT